MTRARDVADTQDNLGGAVPPFVAGKNRIINGDFGIWQRGTSITPASGSNVYTADRFLATRDGTGTVTVSRQTFIPASAPVAGYEGQYFLRFDQTVAGTGSTYSQLNQRIEDVRTFAGQTITVSFWAKAAANMTLTVSNSQNFGSGGSSTVFNAGQGNSVTTSWQRFSKTFSVPSISGKTIGTSSFLEIVFSYPLNVTQTVDIWGVQVEAGSVATPFQTATGTIQGELAACQRYYYRSTGLDGSSAHNFVGVSQSATEVYGNFTIPVTLRAASTTLDFSGVRLVNYGTAAYGISSMSVVESNANVIKLYIVTSSSMTTNRTLFMYASGTPNYVGISAEL
jgi:hypothetical protein